MSSPTIFSNWYDGLPNQVAGSPSDFSCWIDGLPNQHENAADIEPPDDTDLFVRQTGTRSSRVGQAGLAG